MSSSQINARDIHRTVSSVASKDVLTVVIAGECMTPLVESGAKVQLIRERTYWPGDLVVHLAPDGRYLAHRLIGVFLRAGKLMWLTQADSASFPDGPVRPDAILGRVCGGECHADVLNIPLKHRIYACGRFMVAASRALIRRITAYSS